MNGTVLFFFVRLSHRSLTKQHRGRCSKCLKRSTKSCTRGEVPGLGFSGGCRRSVSSGPLASLIFGTLPNFPTNLFDFSPGVVVCVFAVRVFSGLWGLRWCVPVTRASSGLLRLARAACRATRQRPEAAERGAPRGTRAVESESTCALVCSSVNECVSLFLHL